MPTPATHLASAAASERPQPPTDLRRRRRRLALGTLAAMHVLGLLGAPFEATHHLHAPDYSAHQRFHVFWEASKYAVASMLSLWIILKPLAAGERWAYIAILLSNALLYGAVLVGNFCIGGVPAITFWGCAVFTVASVPAFIALAPLRRS